MTGQSEERRTHKRYYFKALVRIAESGEYSNVELESINISAGGIFFRSTRNIDSGKELTLLFSLPGRPDPVEAQCTVMHQLETIPGKQYFIGVKFAKLTGITKEELTTYLAEHFE